jgi:hypothetical protein
VGVEGAVVDLHLPHAALHDRDLVARVADGEPLREPGRLVLLVEQPQAEAVEGGDEDVDPGGARDGGDPLAHLPRRLVGEGDREDLVRVDALLEQPADAVDDDPGLPGAGAGEDEERPLGGGHRLALGRVEGGQIDHREACTWHDRGREDKT